MKFSTRAERIEPFYVMEVAKAAQGLAREVAGTREPMIFLNIGEPDFTAPPLVRQAADRAVRDGLTQYTNALGLDELRERISGWYAARFGVNVPARRIVVTAGASAALQLACLALIDAGDEILMPDPSYPCNRHFVSAADGRAVLVPTTAEERFQLSAAKVEAAWGARTRGVLLASPSNPTGTSIAPDELRRIHEAVRARGGITVIDEIYLGLSYEEAFGHTALALGEDVISINSFSKYFNMTGWRLGWMVVPEAMAPVVEKLSQNLYICPSALSQHAALACFTPQARAEYEARRAEFRRRRDFIVPALREIGFEVPVVPDGAFYVYLDCSRFSDDSAAFADELLANAWVSLVPGDDFGRNQPHRYLRLSYATSMENLQEAVSRLGRYLRERGSRQAAG